MKKFRFPPISLLLVLSLLSANYVQAAASDTANSVKKEIRQLLSQLGAAQKASEAAGLKKNNLNSKMEFVKLDWEAVIAKQKIHDANPVTYDIDKPKTAEAIAYDNEAASIETEKQSILERASKIETEITKAESQIDSLYFEIRSLRNRIHLKTFDVTKYFNTRNCGNMPGPDAEVMEWKSYLDCLFDGVPRNLPELENPRRGTPFFEGDGKTVIVPDYDPEARREKMEQIQEEIRKSTAPVKKPIVVPPPVINDSRQGSVSPGLREIINGLKKRFSKPVSKGPTSVAAVRD